MKKYKKKRGGKSKLVKLTKHHIIPRSRGGRDSNNIAMIPSREHEYYHALFFNRTPDEIISYLVNDFWNYKHIYKKVEEDAWESWV